MEALANAFLQWVLADIVLDRVTSITANMARHYLRERTKSQADLDEEHPAIALRATARGDISKPEFEFIQTLAEASDDMDYNELGKLARGKLILLLEGDSKK